MEKEKETKTEEVKETETNKFTINTKDELISLLEKQQAQISELRQIVDSGMMKKQPNEEKKKEEKVTDDIDEVSKLILE